MPVTMDVAAGGQETGTWEHGRVACYRPFQAAGRQHVIACSSCMMITRHKHITCNLQYSREYWKLQQCLAESTAGDDTPAASRHTQAHSSRVAVAAGAGTYAAVALIQRSPWSCPAACSPA